MVFGLDVGTRTLVGVLAEFDDNENLIIKYAKVKEHENRAMVDGQIHDVNKVSKTISKLIKDLEEDSETEIKEVAVALAGRFLITSEGECIYNISGEGYLTENTVRKIELEAVKMATDNIEEIKGMYCIGYSSLYYEIDGEWIKHLEGQKGNQAKAKVIAAFLPKNVVEAMLSVLEKNNLKPVHITLEPIAAMNVVIPEDLRNLNIVMVDVGAGTSDIAISNEGTIVGYGMVPMAGDEITDAISKELLIDFKTSEAIKKTLLEKENFKYNDILDFEHEISKEELLNIIDPHIEKITKEIADKIMDLNGKPPVAVMIVGGGGKVLGFSEKLAKNLNIPNNRVALKDLKKVNFINLDGNENLFGSEFITPIGIAYVALKKEGNVFNTVSVNGKNVNMMMIGTDMNVMQVLFQAGYTHSQFVGAASHAITFELNNDLKIIKGNLGKEAEIKINGSHATLKSKVKPGDKIEIGETKAGEPLKVKVKEICDYINFFVNGKPEKVFPEIYLNGKKISGEEYLKDDDKIITKPVKVKEVFKKYTQSIYFTIAGNPYEIPCGVVVTKNGEIITEDYEIKENDSFETTEVNIPKVKDFIEIEAKKQKVIFNDKPIYLPVEQIIIKNSGKIIDKESEIKNGANYLIEIVEKRPSLIELFAYLSINTKDIKEFELTINGEKAESFMQPIPENSTVKLNYS